jgi:hypothetical protein
VRANLFSTVKKSVQNTNKSALNAFLDTYQSTLFCAPLYQKKQKSQVPKKLPKLLFKQLFETQNQPHAEGDGGRENLKIKGILLHLIAL